MHPRISRNDRWAEITIIYGEIDIETGILVTVIVL